MLLDEWQSGLQNSLGYNGAREVIYAHIVLYKYKHVLWSSRNTCTKTEVHVNVQHSKNKVSVHLQVHSNG